MARKKAVEGQAAPGQEGSDEPFVPDDEVVEETPIEDLVEEAKPERLSDHDKALQAHKTRAAENHTSKEARKRAFNNREVTAKPEVEDEAEDEAE